MLHISSGLDREQLPVMFSHLPELKQLPHSPFSLLCFHFQSFVHANIGFSGNLAVANWRQWQIGSGKLVSVANWLQ